MTAPLPDGVRITRYTVCAIPDTSINYSIFAIEIEHRGYSRWAVTRMGRCLANDGTGWDYEPLPSSRESDWLVRYRFTDVNQAIAAAVEAAKHIVVNGFTVADVLANEDGAR